MMQRVVVRNSQTQIPTMAKLLAGLMLGATGFFAAQSIAPAIPAGVDGKEQLPLIMGSFGLLVGWRIVGLRPGRRWLEALNDGLRGGIYTVLWTFGFLGALQMLKLAMRMQYKDVLSAVTDILGQGALLGLASMGLTPVITLGLGAMLAGIASEFAYRRWGR